MIRPDELISVDQQVEAWLRHIEQTILRFSEPGRGDRSVLVHGHIPRHLIRPLDDALREDSWCLARTYDQMTGAPQSPNIGPLDSAYFFVRPERCTAHRFVRYYGLNTVAHCTACGAFPTDEDYVHDHNR